MIRNRDVFGESAAHATALDCVEVGIDAAHPERVVSEHLAFDGERITVGDETYPITDYQSIQVIGGGNAAGHVAVAIESILGDALNGGVVVTDDPVETTTVEVLPSDHPIPSQRSIESTQRLLERARELNEETLVLAVITGGGSACMVAPAAGISLDDLQATTDALLDSGASIHEINTVRKHLSAIKGGRLAQALVPAQVSALVLSDVVGDDLDVIASGPLVPDTTTFENARDVIESYDLEVPEAVRERLRAGAAGEHEETPKVGDPIFERVGTHLVGTNLTALEAAQTVAEDRGYDVLILSSRVRGEAEAAALTHVAVAEEIAATGNPVEPPAVILSGGETTVTVTGEGKGGPNQEFALAAALELPDEAVLAAVDTDGIDGNTETAGALVDGDLVTDADEAAQALANNDANPYLAECNALIETGPTGTNVNDLRVLVVQE